MKLLGDWNCYLARWLAWLPTANLHPTADHRGHDRLPLPAMD